MTELLALLHNFVLEIFDKPTIQFLESDWCIIFKSTVVSGSANEIQIECKYDKRDESYDEGVYSLVGIIRQDSSKDQFIVHTSNQFMIDFLEQFWHCECPAANPLISFWRTKKAECICRSQWRLLESFERRFKTCPVTLESTVFEIGEDVWGSIVNVGKLRRHVFDADSEISLKIAMSMDYRTGK